jgi:hypothetical protein
MDRLKLKTIVEIHNSLLAKGIDSVEIGTSQYLNIGTFTLRFGYWEEIKEPVVEMINDILPNHLCISKQLVDESEYGRELFNYIVIRK